MAADRALVLDANILIRLVLGERVRELVLTHLEEAAFFSPEGCFEDARRYLPELLRKRAIDPALALAVLDRFEQLIHPLQESVYAAARAEALERIANRDPRDWRVLAAALTLDCPIWTEDQDFFGTGVPTWTAYVAVCAFAGLRRGEALGVQVGDIDFLARTLRVRRQLQRAKPADLAAAKNLVEAVAGIPVVARQPKYESERTVYLPDQLVTILAEHVREHTATGGPDRWLFDEGSKPWHDNLVDYRWRSTRSDAGLTHKLHDLRHYYASGLIAAGCDVVTVQRAMGHASATTTLSTYAHLWPTAEDKTRAAAADMAAAVLATSLPQIRSI